MAKIERKYLAHYLNATPGTEAATYELTTTKNILGETSVNLSSYEVTASVEPFYADKASKIATLLQDIIDNRKVLDDAKTDYVEVHTWEEATAGKYTAYKETVVVEVTSYGGDYNGYQIPFTLHFSGDRVKGKFDPTTKTFTADDAA